RFGEIVVRSFEWDERLVRWIALTVGRPHWKHYMAFDGATAVATGAIYFSAGYGWIDLAATLSEYRDRGAQGALVRQRLLDGIAAGVKGFVVETAQQTPEKQAPSHRNMLRYGFIEAYPRPNLLLELE
ncbi:MAG TPA: N-acetyltransferase, partial [candidate division Zixibacteria bacterium]|nr:N-acetyltransferase [candidate division Zixibacteria bacterium]